MPSPAQQQREAILLLFCEPQPVQCEVLEHLPVADWQPLLHWLDTSGLALYFLDRLTELERLTIVPPAALARLRGNLADNKVRTRDMIAESTAIHRSFQKAGLSYATLKGFSLWPISVPKLELRSQLDLDFLVAPESAPEARVLLEARGYSLRAISGRSWEFQAEPPGKRPQWDIYKSTPHRTVELHLEARSALHDSPLARTEVRVFHGIPIPVLSPVDLFLGQGLHLFKHICSPFTRTAHALEFRRHILVRHHDDAFWRQLRELAERTPRAPEALGAATLLIANVVGDFAPDALTAWTVDRLPAPVRLWIERYGRHTLFAKFPGSKSYLLLQEELEAGSVPLHRSQRRALLPLHFPKPIARAHPGEDFPARFARYRRQLHFILFRLRFHLVEGFRYLCEAPRWRKRVRLLTADRVPFTAAVPKDRAPYVRKP